MTAVTIISRCLVLLLGVFGPVIAHGQEGAWTELSKGVHQGEFGKWNRSVFMHAREPDVEAVVVPAYGGRIMQYSLHGQNVLLDKPVEGEKGNFHAGGHQADILSGFDDLPAHPTLTIGKVDWQHKPYTLRLLGQPDSVVGVSMEKDVILERETGELALTQRMRNTTSSNLTYSIWSRTAMKPGGFALLPLNKKSRFKEGWTMHKEYDGAFVFDGERYVSLHVRKMDEFLVVYCDAEPTKVGADSVDQWVAYVYNDLLFVKYNPHDPAGAYSNAGNTVELYFDRDVAELQAFSPEVELSSGQNHVFPEKWIIKKLPKPVRTFEEARKVANRIPAGPFGKK